MIRPLVLLAALSLALPIRSTGQPMETAIATTRQDIEAARAELEALRERIAAERAPLSAELRELADAVRTLRRKTATAATAGRDDVRRLERRRAEARQREDDVRFLGDLVTEYRRGVETRVSSAEAGDMRERLGRVDRATAYDPARPNSLPGAAAALAEAAIRAQRERIGGFRGDGVIVADDGTEQAARLAAIGPVAYAVTDSGEAGIAMSRPGLLAPALFTRLSPADRDAIYAVLVGGQATVPLDVTPHGDAMRAAGHRRTWRDELRSGGFVMIPIIAVGLAALLVTLWKLIEMQRVCVQNDEAVAAALVDLHEGNTQAALAIADRTGAPLGALLRDAIACRQAPREHIEEILHEHIVAGIPRLERHLGTLAALGGIAPLLGLLGTVTGMMHTFQLVTLFGTGEARLLSGGISEALITTKFGLSIAIPVLLVHAMLARRVRTSVSRLETSAVMFVNRLKQDGGTDA